ncbi:hypothetical protein PPERSA_08437 [Pseudocohnilembus persalinus]|uniref:Uncharacterized protein n=1 Tax=Pseudocohnilembus persalinus TaxID=266149 RepID=A0A0V0R6B7_PSEPJ|nr:hypothetical protein PPERSA_08437 [Pseudocohnilembus persalinus]|eukprot:KRX10034.1 hypothetical protein PPERSA_08437 [Pseudocohnilembus persalinus]
MKDEKSGGLQSNDQKEIQYTQNIDELVINVNQNLELFLNSNTLEFLLMFSEYNEQIQKKMYTQENIEIVKKQFQYLYLIQQQRDKNLDQFEFEDFNIIDESQKIQKFIKLFILSRFEIDIYNDQEKLNLEYFWDSENQKKKYVQLVNLGDIQGLKVRLGEFLFEKDSLQNLQQKLKEHYKKELENQKWEIIGKLPLVKNFKNVLGGFYGLIKEPFTSYVNGEDIWQGTIKGVKNFAVSIGEESINLTETLFNSVSSVFQVIKQKNTSQYPNNQQNLNNINNQQQLARHHLQQVQTSIFSQVKNQLFGKKEEQHHNITRKY